MRPCDLEKMGKYIHNEINDIILISKIMQDVKKLPSSQTIQNLMLQKLSTAAKRLQPIKDLIFSAYPEAKPLLNALYEETDKTKNVPLKTINKNS